MRTTTGTQRRRLVRDWGRELALSARSNRNRKERRNICVHVRLRFERWASQSCTTPIWSVFASPGKYKSHRGHGAVSLTYLSDG